MARKARVVAAGVPHHVTQRGNNRQDVFLTGDDRRYYLDVLRDRSRQAGLQLLGYCLMTNHVHLVAIPAHAGSLARALGRAHACYAQRFNRRYRRSGHLWQNRFYSCPLGGSHLVRALAYGDLEPGARGLGGPCGGLSVVERAGAWRKSGRRPAAGFVVVGRVEPGGRLGRVARAA
jgi:putative transposase